MIYDLLCKIIMKTPLYKNDVKTNIDKYIRYTKIYRNIKKLSKAINFVDALEGKSRKQFYIHLLTDQLEEYNKELLK